MKQLFHQILYQFRREALLSTITVLGTALAVALVMTILIVFQAKTADYAPEANRSRSLYVKFERTNYQKHQADPGYGHSSPSLWVVKETLYPVKSAEAVTATTGPDRVLASLPASKTEENIDVLYTDDAFWHVYEFPILAGKTYGKAALEGAAHQVVITEGVARRFFGSAAEAVGKTLRITFIDYQVCGVVADVNKFCEFAYAEAYVPYTTHLSAGEQEVGNTSGNFHITLLARSRADFPAIRQEVDQLVAKVNEGLDAADQELSLMGQPDDFYTQLNRQYANQYEDLGKTYRDYFYVILIILLVPAINLSGLTLTRMRRRLADLGLMRAFGATQGQMVRQVLTENLMLTLLGGVLGLVFSYAAIGLAGSWLMQVNYGYVVATMNLSMFDWKIFGVALLLCLVLNLLSAYIPARRVAHTPIVESLNHKL
jgi:putative ABC transport system permease protein